MKDELRGAYKAFLDSPAGKDLLLMLVNREVTAQMEGRKAETAEAKAFAMVRLNTAYEIRTYLDDMSKESKKAGGSQVRSVNPQV